MGVGPCRRCLGRRGIRSFAKGPIRSLCAQRSRLVCPLLCGQEWGWSSLLGRPSRLPPLLVRLPLSETSRESTPPNMLSRLDDSGVISIPSTPEFPPSAHHTSALTSSKRLFLPFVVFLQSILYVCFYFDFYVWLVGFENVKVRFMVCRDEGR
jgi:hypothetical protein